MQGLAFQHSCKKKKKKEANQRIVLTLFKVEILFNKKNKKTKNKTRTVVVSM